MRHATCVTYPPPCLTNQPCCRMISISAVDVSATSRYSRCTFFRSGLECATATLQRHTHRCKGLHASAMHAGRHTPPAVHSTGRRALSAASTTLCSNTLTLLVLQPKPMLRLSRTPLSPSSSQPFSVWMAGQNHHGISAAAHEVRRNCNTRTTQMS